MEAEDDQSKKDNDLKKSGTFEDRMREVAFYYKLSYEKKEYEDINGEPAYYLKGQDLLVDLSQQYRK